MPKALEPGVLFPIVLDSDANKPKETQPTFFAISLTMRMQSQLATEMDDVMKHQTLDEISAANCNLFRKYIKGWKNMGDYRYEDCDLLDLLEFNELRELLRKVMSNQHVSADEKKD